MSASNTSLDRLSDAQRQQVESLLVDFEQSWAEGGLAHAAVQLPADPVLRRPLLIEMVKIDLECRWRRGQRRLLEDYLREFPELGTPDTLPADLIQAECEVRQQFGESTELLELSRRFPRQAAAVQQLLEKSAADYRTALVADSSPTPPLDLPERFGRYRILRKLGQGGMGSVYLAEDTQLDRQVALKVPSLDADPEVRARFLREARAAATLSHPHLCPVHDVGEIDGVTFLTMGYIEGRSLAKVLKGGELSPPRAVELLRQIALAMAEAHDRGVIHRDLKPANIMIRPNGEPVIMDFGLARRVDKGDVRLTQTGSLLGTPAYMSPEQWAGDAARIGPVSDIYSLGVIFYQLLTGKLPFTGTGYGEVMTKVLTEQPVPPSQARPGLDPRLDAVCLKAMRRDAGERYASMRAFAAALAGESRRRRISRRAALGLAGAGLVGAVALWQLRNGPAAKTSPDAPSGTTSETQGGARLFHPGPAFSLPDVKEVLTAVAFSPDNRQILSASLILNRGWLRVWDIEAKKQRDDRAKEFLWSRLVFSSDGRRFLAGTGAQYSILGDVETRKEVRRFDTSVAVHAAAFSADGSHVIMKLGPLKKDVIAVWRITAEDPFEYPQHPAAYAVALSPDGALAFSASKDLARVWDARSGIERYRLEAPSPRCAAFSPDGKHLAIGGGDGVIVLLDTATWKEVRRFEHSHQQAVLFLTFAPGGESILSGGEDHTARLWDRATGKEQQALKGHTAPVMAGAFSPNAKQLVTSSSDGKIRVWEAQSP